MVKFPKKAASKLPPTLSLSSCLAKTCNENEPGCSVLEHLIYVGKIAEALWERLAPDVQTLLPRDVAVSLAALHDVGKIAPGFQVKIWQAVAEEKRSDEARRFLEATGESESAHAKIGCCVLRENALGDWAEAVGMHHGALNASFGEKSKAFYWQELREETIAKLTQIFGPLPTFSTDAPKATREQIELAAGFIVVVDWLGSDENFLVDGKVPDANEAEKRAVEILDSIGWTIPKPFDDKCSASFLTNVSARRRTSVDASNRTKHNERFTTSRRNPAFLSSKRRPGRARRRRRFGARIAFFATVVATGFTSLFRRERRATKFTSVSNRFLLALAPICLSLD